MTNTIHRDQITHLIQDPKRVISVYNLEYSTSEILGINRKKRDKQFSYCRGYRRLNYEKTLSRIKSLVILSVQNNVHIGNIENGHIQATGRDSKNLKHYKCNTTRSTLKNSAKFTKMVKFADVLLKLRYQEIKNIAQTKFNKTKVLGLFAKSMEQLPIAYHTLKDIDENKDEVKNKDIVQTMNYATKFFNNIPSVSRKYYTQPQLLKSYVDGSIEPYLKTYNPIIK